MRGRTHIEVAMLVVVLAMTWLSMPMPSSAQTTVKVGPCWERVDACIQGNVNQNTTNPEFDSRSPKFNPRKLLCCPLIKQIARADVPCFCSIGPILHDTPQGANLTRSLIFCEAIDSLSSFDTTCKGLTPKPTNPTKGPSPSPPGVTPSPTKAPRSPAASNSTRSPTRSPPGSTPRPPSKSPSASPPPSLTPSQPSKTPSASSPSLTPSPPSKTPSASSPSSTPISTQSPAMSPQGQKGDGSCWEKIGSCLEKHVAQRETNPKFNSESKSFNQTEFFCCPLIQQAAKTDKLCFCAIDPTIHQNPTNSAGMLTILNACNVSDSLSSLDAMCSPGSTPPPTASPALSPSGNPAETPELSPPAGILPSSTTPAGDQSGKDSTTKSASTKNSMMGSLSAVLILLTYFLYN